MKRLVLLLILLWSGGAWAGEALLKIGDQEPARLTGVYQIGDTVYIAAEPSLTSLGANVFWHTTSQRLTVRFNDKIASASTFSDLALVDGRLMPLGAPPRFIAGRLCLPLSFLQRGLPLLYQQPIQMTEIAPTVPEPFVFKPYLDASMVRRKMLHLRRIVLDAGHGGHDNGARSPQGFNEKDVNLAITLQLARKLKDFTDLEVILTRPNDTFIPLPQRTRIANEAGADLFMALHANGAYNHQAGGFEVYFLSATASDARAAQLAAMENAEEGAPPGLEGSPLSNDDLSDILRDMIMTENLASSERLAVAVQARLDLAMNLENRGVKQAPFFVLAGAQMPAVLVEVGFMSNPREAEIIRQPAAQARIVSALFDAILYYDALSAATLMP